MSIRSIKFTINSLDGFFIFKNLLIYFSISLLFFSIFFNSFELIINDWYFLFLTSRTDLVNSPNLSYTSGDIDCNNNNRLLNLFNGWDETNRKNFPAKATNTWALIAQIGSYMYNYLEGSDTFSNAGTLVQTMIDEKGRVYISTENLYKFAKEFKISINELCGKTKK